MDANRYRTNVALTNHDASIEALKVALLLVLEHLDLLDNAEERLSPEDAEQLEAAVRTLRGY